MSLIHLIVGDMAAKPLQDAVSVEESLKGEVVVLKDILHVGPLKTEGMNFSEGRSAFWNKVQGDGHQAIEVKDLDNLMEISSKMSNDSETKVWFWMAPTPADVTAYYWLLHFLKKHQGRFSVVNINGLPFLDEQGKLFYPESFSQIPVREIIKARKLARVTSPSEWETDTDEWPRLIAENEGIRILEGGKRLTGKAISHYDPMLLSGITGQNQKANKIINQAISKQKIPTGDSFLHWRLREMAVQGMIEYNKGDVTLAGGNTTTPENDETEPVAE